MTIDRLRIPFLSKLKEDGQGSDDVVHGHPSSELPPKALHPWHYPHEPEDKETYSQASITYDETQTRRGHETLESTGSTTDDDSLHKNHHAEPLQQRRTLRHRIRIFWLDSWTRETLSLVVAVAALASLIAVLAVNRNKPIQDLPSLISINTLVSVISAIMKAALIMPVAEAISQSKWLYFRTSKSLMDFDSVDQASRGPWGSLLLVWRLKSNMHIVTFGAWITIAALAIDPFSQQVINLHPCQIESGDDAFIARTNNFTVPHDGNLTLFNNDLVLSLHGALMDTEKRPSVSFWCPTGNCTFTTDDEYAAFFETLAVQASCNDVTDLAILDEVGTDGQRSRYEWFLPEFRGKNNSIGYDSVAQSDISLRILPSNSQNQSGSDDVAIPKLTIFMLRRREGAQAKPGFKEWRQYNEFMQEVEPLAVECRFLGAVQSLNSEVRQNVLSETVVSSMVIDENAGVSPLKPFHGHIARKWRREGFQRDCWIPVGTAGWATHSAVHIVNDSIVDPSETQNAMDGTWYKRSCVWPNSRLPWLQDYLNEIFGEQALRSGYLAAELDANLVDKWMSKLHSDGNANFTTVETWAKTVAMSLTTTINYMN